MGVVPGSTELIHLIIQQTFIEHLLFQRVLLPV